MSATESAAHINFDPSRQAGRHAPRIKSAWYKKKKKKRDLETVIPAGVSSCKLAAPETVIHFVFIVLLW